MKKRMIAFGLVWSVCMNMLGCSTEAVNQNVESINTESDTAKDVTEYWDGDESGHFEDNDLLYANDDDTSVVTMYLTVTKGSASENADHTWEEINTYSIYDYEAMGVERYAVNGLLQVGDENGPVEGELGYGKYSPNAIVTIRGQTSTKAPQKNYKIKLNDNAGTWNDQQTINLNKHRSEGLRFRNKLTFDLLEELPGTISLQTQFVHLYVKDETQEGNGEFVDYGLYTQVEQPNKSFLERHGLDKNGHLYKINFFEFYRYEDVIMLKNELEYDQKAFEEMIEIKGDDDHSKLIATLEELNDYSIPIEEILEKRFDVENLTSWMAFHILVGNIDTQSRNTLIYSPLNGEKWYFISWDNDAALKRTENNLDEEREIGWTYGVSNYWGNILFQRALKSEEFRKALDDKIELFRSIMTEEKIAEMAQSYAEVVKPYVYSKADRFNAPLTESEYDYICDAIAKEIEWNYQLYKESLECPMPFFIGVPSITDGKIEFSWDNSYDFDSENVFYTFELADNFEFTNPIVFETNIFVPGYTYGGTLEPGQYFVRVMSKNESGKEQYAFDNYTTSEGNDLYGVITFFIMQDGSIEVQVYEE